MNPNAREFKFNPGASSWTPPSNLLPPPVPSPSATKASEAISGASATEAAESSSAILEEEIDENDPLWKETLKICKGDRQTAIKLLDDPDELMKYPSIRVIMESEDDKADEEDWENNIKAGDHATKQPAVPDKSVAAPKPVIASELTASAAADAAEEAAPAEEETVVAEGDPREHLNLVFIGHVDAGKSTLSGSILYVMGMVDQRTIERFEREAKQRNRDSWFLAFILDTSEEERAKGKTVEVGRAHFETEVNRYTILDAPGHKNYVPNMIAGAVQADVAVLVISARKGEFETGFEKGGQTREHALLAKTLGVQYLVVVINKMDDPTVEWDIKRFEECVSKLKPYLKSCGYTIKKEVKFLPIAGLTGDNILREVSTEKCPWWKGLYSTGVNFTTTPTLLSTLDSLRITGRNADAPLRIPCLDRYYERGCVVLGKVESGTLRRNEEILICPLKKKIKVESIYIGETSVLSAKPGENVLIKLQVNVEDVQKGYVLSSPLSICPAVVEIKVQIALVDMLEHRPIFSPGYDAVMHVHTVEIEVTCVALLGVLDNGKPMRRPYARQGQQCIARLSMALSTCVETFATLPSMGRFTLRDEGKTIGIGKVTELIR